MGGKSSKVNDGCSVVDIGKLLSTEEIQKVRDLYNSIQGKTVDHLGHMWQGHLDKHLQQQMLPYVSSANNRNIVDEEKFTKLFVALVRGSVDDKTEVLVDLLTSSTQTEPIDQSVITSYVESLIASFILTHKNTSWQKGTKADIQHFASSLCSELSPKVTHNKITNWLLSEPKISALHAAVLGDAYKITSAKQRLVPTNEKKSSSLLSICSVMFLNSSLPVELRKEWRLLFSSQKHGESFSKLLGFITNKGPTVLLIKDRGGSVFGGFAPQDWSISPKFSGDDRSFLFRLKPTMLLCSSTNFNDHYQYVNTQQQTLPNGLGMGGQMGYWGLWLDSEFGRGQSSESCTTFRNYTMLSTNKEFHVEVMEVWAVGPLPVVEEELNQRSVLDTNSEARAMMEMMGKTSHSDGLREPEEDKC